MSRCAKCGCEKESPFDGKTVIHDEAGCKPAPTANWSCKTCGWLGLELSIGEAPEYHRRWNSKQGKLCTGNLIKE